LMVNMIRGLVARVMVLASDESGMSTVEYSIVTLYTRRTPAQVLILSDLVSTR